MSVLNISQREGEKAPSQRGERGATAQNIRVSLSRRSVTRNRGSRSWKPCSKAAATLHR